MYDALTSLLVDNPIDRYLINSSMLPDLVQDTDGGYTLHLQSSPPTGADHANWLPTPTDRSGSSCGSTARNPKRSTGGGPPRHHTGS